MATRHKPRRELDHVRFEDRLSRVDVGEKFIRPRFHEIAEREETVKRACDNKTDGYWWCVTHGKGFRNQWEKDAHIDWEHGEPAHAHHRLAWICFAHGPEVP